MTVPNTPAGSEAGASVPHDPVAPLPLPPSRERRPFLPELWLGLIITAAGAVLGVLLGVLWVWLAPRVPLQVSGQQILYVDPEGEQRAGADSIFALLGLGIGAACALAAFLLTRRRGGGIAVAVGLAAGGLAGSVIGWQLGMALGPTTHLIAHAKQVGDGGRFAASIELGAKGALLVWPMAAMVLLLALSAAFGKREQDPPPYWASPVPATEPLPAPEPVPAVSPAPAGEPQTVAQPEAEDGTDGLPKHERP